MGSPGQGAAKWRLEGATFVVSLLRDDSNESKTFALSRDSCLKCGLRWENAPIGGKRSMTTLAPGPEDLTSLNHLRDLMPQLLHDGHHVVVHCAAGMHRTGGVVFCTLRHCGFTIEQSLKAIEAGRPVTHGALLEEETVGENKQPLWEIVE